MTGADRGALLVVGGTSGAGKSTVVSALCRSWARAGDDVAPFKAQNMSNHAAVTPDGGEIGRAQAVQARAARQETDRRMNPVLLKPDSGRSHLVVLGEEDGVVDARGYGDRTRELRDTVLDSLVGLRREHHWLVAEGAGGAAEVNLLDRDLVNLPLATAAGLPALLVVDIDRGGAFATAYGTWALLPEEHRKSLRGVVFNRFRGDPSLLDPGIEELQRRTGLPTLGVLPHLGEEPMLGVEDSLDLDQHLTGAAGHTPRPLRVAVVRLPHLSNPADLDPLRLEPDVELSWAWRPGQLTGADLVVLPGSRATVADLHWLRSRGLADALTRHDGWVLGLCGGYQMLGRTILDEDGLESTPGARVPGLGLLPVETGYARPKTVTRSSGPGVAGYQIRWGRPEVVEGPAWLALDTGDDGCRRGRVLGSSLHGLLDADELRAALLSEIAADRGRDYRPGAVSCAVAWERHLDRLADWIEDGVDMAAVRSVAAGATVPGREPGW